MAARFDDPSTWPLRSVLPLRRDRDGGRWPPDLGYLEASARPGSTSRPRVVLGVLGERPTGEVEEFTSWDALEAAGWRID